MHEYEEVKRNELPQIKKEFKQPSFNENLFMQQIN